MKSAIPYHYDGFPPARLDWERIIPFIGPATAALARYDGTLQAIPNPNVLLSPMTVKEAVLSSRIEGTVTTIGEVLEFEAGRDTRSVSASKAADIFEVINYRRAMSRASTLLETLPMCQRVLKELHRVLMAGVRGQDKAPGEYRREPNWIGEPGCTIDESRFVPISADRLLDGMDIWEKFIHTDTPDRLVQTALLHAEFEAIHPFRDGNGRVGRMTIPLFLLQSEFIKIPAFYISGYFEEHRDEYYERLLSISRDGAWTDWCIFFLKAVAHQAIENRNKAVEILDLYEKKKEEFMSLTHSQYAILALDFIFNKPSFMSTDFVKNSGIPAPTAKRILRVLRESGVLSTLQTAQGRRAGIYTFSELVNAAEGREVF